MSRNSLLTQSKFERMLDWLNADRQQAGRKYEAIRRRLTEILAGRGCHEAEDLADETIDRVVSKIDAVVQDYEGDPAYYFYGVAKRVHLEWLKKAPPPHLPPPTSSDEVEREHACLEHCLARLPAEDRELVLGYYSKEQREKIMNRNELARKLGIALNNLRIRVYRIRLALKDCIEDCLGRETP
jgi:DNA-directed RNA polymerase specialized sigma24 family protein